MRGRIKAQRNRLLSIAPSPEVPDPEYPAALLPDCAPATPNSRRPRAPTSPSKVSGSGRSGCTVRAAKERWERLFPPGPRLWHGLTSAHYFIEHYGSGGGLTRPLFAEALAVAGDLLAAPGLRDLAARYAALGEGWRNLADAALPDAAPLCREAKALYREQASLLRAGASPAEDAATWQSLADLGDQVTATFPFDDASAAALRADLQARVRALYEGEVAALQQLGAVVAELDAAVKR